MLGPSTEMANRMETNEGEWTDLNGSRSKPTSAIFESPVTLGAHTAPSFLRVVERSRARMVGDAHNDLLATTGAEGEARGVARRKRGMAFRPR
jgi:hypothetical protein